ncbi:MAG: hypothetical protein HFE59_01105 [Clostridiales bacterium]|nr:hypothetical protein [Clostridiales bacterium]
MLTNIFYYDFYKPYIFKNEKIASKHPVNYPKTENRKTSSFSGQSEENKNEYSFFLNKSFKNEIVNYAETISIDLNSIKNLAKNIINKTDSYFDTVKENLKSELKEFKKRYNTYTDFADKNYKHSPLLSNFSDSLKYRVESNYELLSKFGISYVGGNVDADENLESEYGKLFFDENYFDSLSTKNISENIKELREFCKSIYNDTCEIMTVPMEEHMNFKNLNYYYNYIFSNEKPNTVKIIETGMLVDIIL